VPEFHRLSDEGILPSDERFELIDGEIIRIMPPGPEHSFFVEEIAALFAAAIGPLPFHARQEKPSELGLYSEPQPDVLLVRGHRRDYRYRNPGPDDVLLVVEVSDSSLDYDRTAKLLTYAATGVPEYWILNVRENRIEIHRQPHAEGYGEVTVAAAGETLPIPGLPEARVAVRDLLAQATS
jgi:Uma2 family endonuclease